MKANTFTAVAHAQAIELVGRLWHAITKLPGEQRDAFTFGFEDEAGQGLSTVLLGAGIVTWDELADGMQRSVEEIAKLRMPMPMAGSVASHVLGTERKNVWKWRYRAIR